MGRLSKLLRCGAMAALALSALGSVQAAPYPLEANPSVVASSTGLTVNGASYHIKGVAYSPVPVGESVSNPPYGDYFTPDYAYIWARDLPAIKAAGFNTVRIYSWSNTVDHSVFLDALEQFGLQAIVTFYVTPLTGSNPTWTKTEQDAVIASYASSVGLYGDHPAILMWAFGNELNGPWIGLVQAFDVDTSNGQSACNWQTSASGGGSCYNTLPDWTAGSACDTAATCMYGKFYGWLTRAAQAGRQQTTRPQTSTFADVDYFMTGNPGTDRLARFGSGLSGLDVITVQVYRGSTFGSYFTQFKAQTSKPLLIGEYGADAYNDPCGWPENNPNGRGAGPCTNYFGQSASVGGETGTGCSTSDNTCTQTGVAAQSTFDKGLYGEMLAAPSDVIGGVLMEWHDQYWKNQDVQDKCAQPCSVPATASNTAAQQSSAIQSCYSQADFQSAGVSPASCGSRAHITCGNYDARYHDLCGYFLGSAPDSYVNEAWFGLNGVSDCGDSYADSNTAHRLSALLPRQVLTDLTGSAQTGQTCTQLKTCKDCVTAQTAAQYQGLNHNAPGIAQGLCNSQCGFTFAASGSSSSGSSHGSTGNGNPDADGGDAGGNGSTSSGSSGGSTVINDDSTGNGGGGSGDDATGEVDAAMTVQASIALGAALASAAMLL